ncbi:MAG: DsbA family protein [Acidobacteriota bacterium]|nr:DsbA family protein [Acidobacteriota bacterium]
MRRSLVRLSLVAVIAGLAGAVPFAQADRPADQQETITRQQADEIIQELKQIRMLLQRVTTPQPAQAPQGPAPSAEVKLPSVSGYMLGSPIAPVTMVEFTDLECPFCRQFHMTAFEQIKKNFIDTGKLRYISLDFPLNIHPYAMQAAEAAQCAGEQGKFWEMRHIIFVNNPHLTPDSFETFAKDLKLNLERFDACVLAGKYAEQITKDQEEGAEAGVSGTPTFIIGRTTATGLDGVRLVGAMPYPFFEAAIQKALAGK